MKLINTTTTTIELAGTAKEFSSLARAIKGSKSRSSLKIDLQEPNMAIELQCTTITCISINHHIKIQFTENTKNYLHSLTATPADTTTGSLFVISPVEHEGIFSARSMALALNITPDPN